MPGACFLALFTWPPALLICQTKGSNELKHSYLNVWQYTPDKVDHALREHA